MGKLRDMKYSYTADLFRVVETIIVELVEENYRRYIHQHIRKIARIITIAIISILAAFMIFLYGLVQILLYHPKLAVVLIVGFLTLGYVLLVGRLVESYVGYYCRKLRGSFEKCVDTYVVKPLATKLESNYKSYSELDSIIAEMENIQKDIAFTDEAATHNLRIEEVDDGFLYVTPNFAGEGSRL
jgi:hypothetical protein